MRPGCVQDKHERKGQTFDTVFIVGIVDVQVTDRNTVLRMVLQLKRVEVRLDRLKGICNEDLTEFERNWDNGVKMEEVSPLDSLQSILQGCSIRHAYVCVRILSSLALAVENTASVQKRVKQRYACDRMRS